MKIGPIIALAGIGLAGAGLYYFYTREKSLLQNSLQYKLIGFTFGDLSLQTSTATLVFRISSDATIEAKVNNLYMEVYVGAVGSPVLQKLGIIQDSTPFVIPARGYSDVSLTVIFSPQIILGDAINLLTNYLGGNNDFAINLVGYVAVKSAFISVSVPFTYNTTLKQLLT